MEKDAGSGLLSALLLVSVGIFGGPLLGPGAPAWFNERILAEEYYLIQARITNDGLLPRLSSSLSSLRR